MPETDIKEVGGIYLPAPEEHLVEWMTRGKRAHVNKGKITYQWWKQEFARDVAADYGFDKGSMLDIGAHCGLWAMWWTEWVPYVFCIEPIPIYQKCLHRNLAAVGRNNYRLLPYAVSDKVETLKMRVDLTNTGGTRQYAPGETHDCDEFSVAALPVDHLMSRVASYGPNPSIMKIDCEGLEQRVLLGAAETIRAFRPLVIVEQKFESKWFGYQRHGAVEWLKAQGYVVVKELSGDFVMRPA